MTSDLQRLRLAYRGLSDEEEEEKDTVDGDADLEDAVETVEDESEDSDI